MMFDLKALQDLVTGNIAGVAVLGWMLRYFMVKCSDTQKQNIVVFQDSQNKILAMSKEMCDAFKDELKICQEDKMRLLGRITGLEKKQGIDV